MSKAATPALRKCVRGGTGVSWLPTRPTAKVPLLFASQVSADRFFCITFAHQYLLLPLLDYTSLNLDWTTANAIPSLLHPASIPRGARLVLQTSQLAFLDKNSKFNWDVSLGEAANDPQLDELQGNVTQTTSASGTQLLPSTCECYSLYCPPFEFVSSAELWSPTLTAL